MDMLEPTTGVVERDHGARVALVNQHHADQINLDLTPLHWMHTQVVLF
jgi:ATP-binding cassette subfamily F protein 3